MDSVLTLTSVSEVGGKILGSRVSALQLQVAPGEQAPLDRPEQGGEHRAHLPLSSINHQQLTLHKRRQMESVYKVTCRTQPGRSLREQLSEVKRFNGLRPEAATWTEEFSGREEAQETWMLQGPMVPASEMTCFE